MFIGVIGWIVLGMIAGFIASKSVNLHGDDPRLGILVGGAGGLLGGLVYRWFSGPLGTGLNAFNLILAVAGAVAALFAWHTWRKTARS